MFVTSFSPKGYEQYGKRFLASYKATGQTIPLLVYYEQGQPEKPEIPNVDWMPLDEVRGFREAEQQLGSSEAFKGRQANEEGEEIYNFRFDAFKFFRKVYAVYDAYYNASRSTKAVYWVDADVEFIRPIPPSLPTMIFPRDEALAFIGRANQYSECGFMGFNLDEEGPLRRFMMIYWSLYGTGAFTSCREWHDSYLFDHAMVLSAARGYSLTGDKCESLYPWDECILSDWMVHNKGPERKEKAYADAA
jgi:hypothetical protein